MALCSINIYIFLLSNLFMINDIFPMLVCTWKYYTPSIFCLIKIFHHYVKTDNFSVYRFEMWINILENIHSNVLLNTLLSCVPFAVFWILVLIWRNNNAQFLYTSFVVVNLSTYALYTNIMHKTFDYFVKIMYKNIKWLAGTAV